MRIAADPSLPLRSAYASFRSEKANSVADAIILCCSNAAFETLAAFCVFGVVGFIGITPESYGDVSSFSLGFLTFPEAVAQMRKPYMPAACIR